jgi:predicted O-methyltransferase YrrM
LTWATFSPFDQVALATLIRRVAKPNCKMAEVGSWLGTGSTAVFQRELRTCGGSSLLCVDTWEGNPNVQRHQELVARYDVLGTFRANVRTAQSSVTLVALIATSIDAAGLLADDLFDLVFLDADHSYASVRDDIACWRPKVRPGGILCGHDCEARMKAPLERRIRENLTRDAIPGDGTPFREIHPGSILAVHEAFRGASHLFAEQTIVLPDGATGRSTIWFIET